MNTQFKPLNGQVVIKPEDTSIKSTHGIIIPPTADKDAPVQGVVHAVAEDSHIDINPGDLVIYQKYGGSEVTIDEQDYIILSQDDILIKIIND